eukprot:scaffold20665_cov131-Skeletonema_marinoi.AAC.7
MAESSTNRPRHAAPRKRGGRARGQMAGGMLASLSAVSDKPKPTTASQHSAHGTSSSLMNLDNKEESSRNNVDQARTAIPNNKAHVGQKRVPLKEATMNRVVERQEVKLKAKILSSRPRSSEQQVKRNAATEISLIVAPVPTTDKITTPRNNNPDVVMSPSSILSSVADDDDTLTTPPPLTSVKMKHHQLETTLLSPISFVGLSLSTPSPPPAKMKVTAIDNNKVLDHNDEDDEEESYAQSKDGSSKDSLEHSNSSHDKEDTTMSNESTNKSQAVDSCSNSSTISNEEIANNPRTVINRKIAKDFYGKTFIGTVVGYDDGEYPAFWQVEYLDGDGEDFSYAELMSGMDYYEELERDGNIPSMDDCDVNSSYEQSLCDDYDDDDANENDDDEVCFDEEETDDDEDYSIEQESDSEDELEIDEGVDSDIKNGKSRGKKGSKKARSKLTTKNQVKSDTVSEGQHSDEQSSGGEMICSLDECRIDLSAQIDNDNDEIGDDDAGDVEVVDSSLDDDTDTSDETKDSDPVAVEVQSEDEEMVDDNGFEDDAVVADYDVTGITSESDAPDEVEESISIVETEVQVEDALTSAKKSESAPIKMQEEWSVVEATSEQQKLKTTSEEASADKGAVEEAIIEQEYPTSELEGTVEQDLIEEATIEPQEPTTLELFAVVDRIFLESDADTVTVKDVKNAVAFHFGLQKVQKEMKQTIKSRLIDLIQGNVQPIRAMKEATTDGDDMKDYDQDDQGGAVAAEAESSGAPQNGYDEASLTGEASFSCDADASFVTSNSQADSFSSNASVSFGENVGDSMAMTGTLFSNLSPEFSIHSRTADDGNGTNVNDYMKMKSVSSPLVAAKPKSRSAVVKGKWSLGPEIGVGSFGRVHTGLNAVNGSKFVSGSKMLMLASFSN